MLKDLVIELDDELDKLKIQLAEKDQVISELQTDLTKKNADFDRLETQVEDLSELVKAVF